MVEVLLVRALAEGGISHPVDGPCFFFKAGKQSRNMGSKIASLERIKMIKLFSAMAIDEYIIVS